MFERTINHHYDDPVDLIWMRAAEDLGLKIVRSADVFAAYDGKGTLTISRPEDFDADDCLAQMIFHEICHWLVAGRQANHLEDWGLSNIDDRDLVVEYAAHRLQATLSAPYGLRDFMAVTTDWRPYWDGLPDDPLRDGDDPASNDPATTLAKDGAHLARFEPFVSVLQRSLAATAAIADVVREIANPSSLWRETRARHRLGALLSAEDDLRCGTCAWAFSVGDSDSEQTAVCRQHKQPNQKFPAVQPDECACECWERVFTIDDCGTCGACCHRGFDLLTVAEGDPFLGLHPELVQLRDDGQHCVPRPGGICVALEGNGELSAPYRCRDYENRPRNCAEFEVAGDACLVARRRVGLSR